MVFVTPRMVILPETSHRAPPSGVMPVDTNEILVERRVCRVW